MISEPDYLQALAKVFDSRSPEVLIGIGDDAAIISPQKRAIALSTDMAVEGTHFTRGWSSLYEIGGKITAANLADIYAMGGEPKYLLVAAAIPSDFSLAEVTQLAEGIRDEASKVGAYIVGGDLTRSSLLVLSISVFGEVGDPILRSSAKVGDLVALSSLPGESSRGLERLKSGINDEISSHHRYPRVEYSKIAHLNRATVHSLTDVSDGLIEDLSSISKLSGVGIDLDSTKTTLDPHVLHGGEDHVFVGTFSAIPEGWIEIGVVTTEPGVRLDGKLISHQGFKHF